MRGADTESTRDKIIDQKKRKIIHGYTTSTESDREGLSHKLLKCDGRTLLGTTLTVVVSSVVHGVYGRKFV